VADHTDDQAVVRQAVEALLSIGCWGLHDSHRSEVWVLAKRAKQVLDALMWLLAGVAVS
jgi:hypothetical protein